MPVQKDSIPIVQTKLYRPPVTGDLVVRKKLCARLEEGRKLPLTLVAAPAGYGKSTLVSHWVEQSGHPTAWLSLEESDSDLRVFLAYFVAAVQSVYPKACTKMAALIRSRDLPPVHVLARELNNDLNGISKPLVVVLDDYHSISKPAVHEVLGFQLKHRLPQLNLVVVSRRNPPLPSASLRAQHLICEIRMSDLMFSLAETSAFLRKASPCTLDSETTGLLHEALEGWPVGLRLALMALGEDVDKDRLFEGISGESALVQEYLMTEVLSGLSPVRRKCLFRISILNRFCTPLCEALCDGACGNTSCMYDEQQILGSREAWTPLCVSLDTRNHWFRFHHVFQNVLQRSMCDHLQPEEIHEIHRRAMVWLESNDLIEEAMFHALKAGGDEAANLIVRHRHHAMNEEQWVRLLHWLDQLPQDAVRQNPDLLLLRSWCSLGYPEMFDALDEVEDLLKDMPPNSETTELRGELLAYRSMEHYVMADSGNTVRIAEEALQLLGPGQLSERGFAYILLVLGKQMQGHFTEGRADVFYALRDRSILQTTCHSRLLNALCFGYWMEADQNQLMAAAKEYYKLGQTLGFAETIDLSCYFVGIHHYARNELDEAAKHLEQVVDNPEISNLHNYIHCTYALAMTRQAQGQETKAIALVKDTISRAFQTHNPTVLLETQAFEAELAFRQGRLAEASQWAGEFDPASPSAMYRFYVPHFTKVRILLAQDGNDSIQEAARLSLELCGLTEKTHNRHYHIAASILNAMALDKMGRGAEALPVLGKAVKLAQPGGGIRSFVDEGPHVASLLNQLDLEGESLRFVGSILAAFKSETEDRSSPRIHGDQKLLDPFSKREREVFALMAQELGNREIGEKLFISPGTVKRHTNSIYSKLAVHSRRDAVVKARGLGLLDG